MPTFIYIATDAYGKISSGSMEARDQKELRTILRGSELYLTKFRETGEGASASVGANTVIFAKRTKPRDIVIAIRQMAALIHAGVPLTTGLSTIQLQCEKPALRQAIKQVQEGVVEGRSLHSAMRDHPKLFNHLTVSLVESGEGTGTLDKALEVAAFQLDRENELKARVKGGMVYPKIVIGAAVGTVALMLILVVPTFKQIYKEFHGELPAPTQALITISDFTVHWWWAILLVILGLWYAFREYRKTPAGGRRIDTIQLKLPIVGPVLRKVAVARFTQTFAAGFRGGVPIIEALNLASSTAGNAVIRDAVMGASMKVREGQPIAQELDTTGQFPPLVIQMIRSGEMTGTLDDMLEEVNRYYDEDIKHSIDAMVKMVEPAMTFIVGGIVLFVLLALYMPVFNLGKTISGGK